MNSIERLIAELCPDGVEHIALGDVAEYSNVRISADELDETNFVGVDNLVANGGGRIDAVYSPNTEYVTAFKSGDILLGNIRPYLKKIWLADRLGGASGDVLVLTIKSEYVSRLNSGFLFLLLSEDRFFSFDQRHARGGKMPRGDKSMILKYRVPVPPLVVQQRIVGVLDVFSKLEAELEAELEARRAQYAFYRDRLLSFSESGQVSSLSLSLSRSLNLPSFEVVWKPLGEIARVETGEKLERGIGIGHFAYVNGGVQPSGWVAEVNSPGMMVTIPARGSVGVVGFQWGEFWLGPLCYRLVLEENVDSRFLYHQLKSRERQLIALQQTGSIPALNKKDLVRFRVPVPPVVVQQRIADVLDGFDSLVNDLSSGLPAEIAARRRQYEYYRDHLLSFPAKQ